MSNAPIVDGILRTFQFLFGVVILGLSVTLIRGHQWGDLPSTLGYAAFLGGITIIAALVGVAAYWIHFLEGIVGAAIDVIVALLNIAGGITMAIKLDGVTCKNNDSVSNLLKLAGNEFFNGGCAKFEGKKLCYLETRDWARKKIVNTLLGHCRESSADMVFMFLAAALLLATAGLSFLKRRKGY